MFILLIYRPFDSSICHYPTISHLLSDWDYNSLSDFELNFPYHFELYWVDFDSFICSNFISN